MRQRDDLSRIQLTKLGLDSTTAIATTTELGQLDQQLAFFPESEFCRPVSPRAMLNPSANRGVEGR